MLPMDQRFAPLRQNFKIRKLSYDTSNSILGFINFVWPHKATWEPAFGNNGVEVKAGYITRTTIRFSEEAKLPYPYSNCVSEYPSIFERVKGREYAQIPYSKQICYLMCAASKGEQPHYWPKIFGFRFNGSQIPSKNNTPTHPSQSIDSDSRPERPWPPGAPGSPGTIGYFVNRDRCRHYDMAQETCSYEWLLYASHDVPIESLRECNKYCAAPECVIRRYITTQNTFTPTRNGDEENHLYFGIQVLFDPYVTYATESPVYCSTFHHN